MAQGIKDFLYMFQLGSLNRRPGGSNSECSGCDISALICSAFQLRALSNIFRSYFCDLPVTFPAILTVVGSLFLLLASFLIRCWLTTEKSIRQNINNQSIFVKPRRSPMCIINISRHPPKTHLTNWMRKYSVSCVTKIFNLF